MPASRLSADNNDWAGFVKVQGGIDTPRRRHAIQLLKAYSDKAGRYGEPIGWQTFGVRHDNVNVPTRIHTWTLSYKPKQPDDAFERRALNRCSCTGDVGSRTAPAENFGTPA